MKIKFVMRIRRRPTIQLIFYTLSLQKSVFCLDLNEKIAPRLEKIQMTQKARKKDTLTLWVACSGAIFSQNGLQTPIWRSSKVQHAQVQGASLQKVCAHTGALAEIPERKRGRNYVKLEKTRSRPVDWGGGEYLAWRATSLTCLCSSDRGQVL